MSRRHRVFLVVGIVSLIFALLPWLGFGPYAFVVPGTDIFPPRLDVLASDPGEFVRPVFSAIYTAMEFPLYLVALIPPLDDAVYFQGEGRAAVRPFMVFVFWFVVGVTFVWFAIRPLVLPRTYGRRTNR